MSRQLREELAEELGVAHLVQGDYWGNVPARHCGGLVRQAILRAERTLSQPEANVNDSNRPANPPRF